MTDKLLVKKTDDSVTFVPIGSSSSIRLSAAMVRQFIAVPTKSGVLPTERDCIKFVMLCQARGLNPFEGDAFLIGYDGKDGPQFSLITAHQAFLKRAELSPEYNGMESGVSVINEQGEFVERAGDFTFSNEKLVGAWARVHFKTRAVPMFKRIKRETFDTGRSRWEKDPAGMLVKCVEADGLRSSFPTLLGRLYIEEEMAKVISDESAREPIAMPRELPAEITAAHTESAPASAAEQKPPDTQQESKQEAKEEPTQNENGSKANAHRVTGMIEHITSKSGVTNGREWTRYGIKVAGEYYNTFDAKHHEIAQEAKALEREVIVCYMPSGKYRDLASIQMVLDVQDETAKREETPF